MSEERPCDPNNPPFQNTRYTKKEFIQCYGKKVGNQMWYHAGMMPGGERRRDPTNNPKMTAAYTHLEFIQFYGAQHGERMWAEAGRLKAAALAKPVDDASLREQVRALHTESMVLTREREDMQKKIKGMADRVAVVEKALPPPPSGDADEDPGSPRRDDLGEQCRELHTEAMELRRAQTGLLKEFDGLVERVTAIRLAKVSDDDSALDARGRSSYRLLEQCRGLHSEYCSIQFEHDKIKKTMEQVGKSLEIAEKLPAGGAKAVGTPDDDDAGSPRSANTAAHSALLEQCRELHTTNMELLLQRQRMANYFASIAGRLEKLEKKKAGRAPKKAAEEKEGLTAPEDEECGSPRTNNHFSLLSECRELHSEYMEVRRAHDSFKHEAAVVAERIIAAEGALSQPTADDGAGPREKALSRLREQCRDLHSEYSNIHFELSKLLRRAAALSGEVTELGGPQERRKDPTMKASEKGSDKYYSLSQFQEFYGHKRGKTMWQKSLSRFVAGEG